jgi:hypothetical protein
VDLVLKSKNHRKQDNGFYSCFIVSRRSLTASTISIDAIATRRKEYLSSLEYRGFPSLLIVLRVAVHMWFDINAYNA